MDQPLTRGSYVQAGGATYLIIQHDALAALPTVIGLPATPTPLPHRPPLVIHDEANDLWIHTFAPATLLRADITGEAGQTADEVMAEVERALASVCDVAVPRTQLHAE